MPYTQAKNDETLELVINSMIPPKIRVFVEKKIIPDLLSPIILDFAEFNETQIAFIPPLPKPLTKYSLYEPISPDSNDLSK